MKTRTRTFALLAAAPLAACQPAAAPQTAAPVAVATAAVAMPAGATPVERGKAFAERYCSQCHAVTPDAVSPNPNSPPFEMVANAPGTTVESLNNWLHNSHDFPQEMYFVIADEHIDDLASYILTLRRKGYEPPIQ